MMRYGSVCSGIEAASVAWETLGWSAAWLAEIEPFPSAVLAHHYPEVPNLGDMTTIPARILSGEVEAPDILVGGTPCQSFSVAGLRHGLGDSRGRLTQTYVEIFDAIDTVRARRGESPALCVWENVPGVLSDRGNAFGEFLAALCGEDRALEPPRGRWTNAGLVLGPTREVAWRVLDAQYFGVAQRRRRVFVVAGSPACRIRPSQVLLVEEGVRRDSPPRRSAGQEAARGAGAGAPSGGGRIVAPPLTATNDPSRSPQSAEVTAQVEAVLRASYPEVVGTLSDGAHNGGGSTDRTPTPVVSYPSQYPEVPEVAWCLQHRDAKGADSDTKPGHLLPVGGSFDPVALGFYPTEGREFPCFHELAPTVKVGSGGSSGNPPGVCVTGERTHALKAEGADGSEDGTGRGTPIVSVALRGREGGGTAELGDDVQNCLRASSGGGDKAHALVNMAVRRLTPVECERLQGFPDEWTRIPWKRRPADECPDGPRYKALGNSMAVPCMRWIGKQIEGGN